MPHRRRQRTLSPQLPANASTGTKSSCPRSSSREFASADHLSAVRPDRGTWPAERDGDRRILRLRDLSPAVEISGGIVYPAVPLGHAGAGPGLSRAPICVAGSGSCFRPAWGERRAVPTGVYRALGVDGRIGVQIVHRFRRHGPTGSLLMDIHKELNGRVGGMRFWAGHKSSAMQDV